MVRNEQWDEWFDKQYDLLTQIKKAIDGLSADKTEGSQRDQFKAALWSAIVETGAEEMRTYLNLDGWKMEVKDEKEVVEPSADHAE